jgi:hypothetical protein
MRSGILLLLASVLTMGSARLFILSGAHNGTEFETAEFYKKGDDFSQFFQPISGILVDASSSDVYNKIVYISNVPKSQLWTRIFELKDRGVVGVIYGVNYVVLGQDFCNWTGEDMSLVLFPIAEVNMEEFAPVIEELQNGAQIEIHLTSEGNAWASMSPIVIIVVFRVFLGGYSFALAIFGLYKLGLFIKIQGSHFNIPQVCLGIEIIGNLWRVIYLVVDPLGCSFVYGSAANSFLDSVSIPYTTATFVILSFYWYEVVTDASIVIYPFLSKLKIPFFFVMFLLIAMDMTLSLAGFFFEFSTTTPMSVIYLIVSVGFLIFYVITLVRVMKRMQMSKEVRGSGKKIHRLNRINTKMILNAVSRFCFIIVGIAYIFPAVNRYPTPYIIIWAFVYFTLTTDSLMRILLFDIPSTKASSKRSGTDETRLSSTNGSVSVPADSVAKNDVTNPVV